MLAFVKRRFPRLPFTQRWICDFALEASMARVSRSPMENLFCSDPNCPYCRDLRLLTEQVKQGRSVEPERPKRAASSAPELPNRPAA